MTDTQKNVTFDDLNSFFRKVDFDDFVKNHDFYLKQPLFNILRDQEKMDLYLPELIKINRGDLFRHFANTPERKRGNIFSLMYAIKHQDIETVKFLMTPAVFKMYAALDLASRQRHVRQTLEKLVTHCPDTAADLLTGFHKHNVIKNTGFYADFYRVVERQSVKFLKAYYDAGYKIEDQNICNLIAQAARLGNLEIMEFLHSKHPNAVKNSNPPTDSIRRTLNNDHVAAFAKLFDMGYEPDLERKYINEKIYNARSIEMIELMRAKGFKLPADREKMQNADKNFKVKRYLDRVYLYEKLQNQKLVLSDQDIEHLKSQDLAHLRKVQSLPSGKKGRGITLAALSGHFNIVADAARRHDHPAPFGWKDMHKYDDDQKLRPIDALMAYDDGRHLFDADMWKGDVKNLTKLWEGLIPFEKKHLYKAAFENCKSLMSFKKGQHVGKNVNPGIRRRPNPKT